MKTIAILLGAALWLVGCAARAETPPRLAIHDIQGRGDRSSWVGETVETEGVVTAITGNGLFLQTSDQDVDTDALTSEGVFVFTSRRPAAPVAVGVRLRVTAEVREFVPAADPVTLPVTELAAPTRLDVVAASAPLPQPIVLTTALVNPASGFGMLERLEGMRVRADELLVVGPTLGTVDERRAVAASNGVFFGVLPGTPRPLREAGIHVFDPLPAGAPRGVPRFDGNPERLRVDSDALAGSSPLDVPAGARVATLVGPLDFAFRTWTILSEPGVVIVQGGALPVLGPPPPADEVVVGSFNMQRFFDPTDDPAVDDVVLSAEAFAGRLRKVSVFVRQVLAVPDLLVVQEVENLATLQRVADTINADAAAEGRPAVRYQAFLQEGLDPGGIDLGVLANRSTVSVIDVTQVGRDAFFVNPRSGRAEALHDRPPLVIRAALTPRAGPPVALTVVGLHLRSLNGVDDPSDGVRVREKRRAQAEYVASLVQREQTSGPFGVLVVGDFNAFSANDGYVDVMGTIRGAPSPPDRVVTPSPDLVEPDLVDLGASLRDQERYSYVFDGHAQTLDHVLASALLAPVVRSILYPRVDADAPEVWRGSFDRADRTSDHDPVLVRLAGVR